MTSATGEGERSLNRRLDSLRRERDSVRRLLEQASLNGVAEGIDKLGKRLDRLDSELSNPSHTRESFKQVPKDIFNTNSKS